ncbi:hypothetical protein ACIBG0_19135 [Nocardia sp. NPDC050630]|uniref:hypothetical protein n=1 Tax=Nocardia sp. NPDC050630 TaxID=3364321 RepID=UPI003795F493
MTYEDYQRRVIEAQEQWNRDRDWIYKTESGYHGFDGETQPPHITTPDSYDHLTLEQMQTAVSAMKPKLVDDAVTMWANIGADLTGTFEVFKREFDRTINGQNDRPGWTGVAAQAAVTAVNNYYEKSVPLAQAATLTSLKLAEMKTGLEQTQALMPGLSERPDIAGKTLPKDGVMKTDEYTSTEAEQEGRRILRTVYGQVAGQTDVGVPYMPTAPTIVDGPGPVTPGRDAGGTHGSSGSDDGSAGTGGDGSDGSGNPGQDSGEPTGTEQSTTPSTTTPNATTTASTTPQSSTATMPSASTTTASPSTSTPSLNTPGIGTTTGRPTSTGTPGATQGSPGRSIAGTPATTTTAAAATTRQSTATSGRSGMSGMGAPGQNKSNDDDRKKAVPDYLITAEHGEELTGLNSHPKTVPPVIGEPPTSDPAY